MIHVDRVPRLIYKNRWGFYWNQFVVVMFTKKIALDQMMALLWNNMASVLNLYFLNEQGFFLGTHDSFSKKSTQQSQYRKLVSPPPNYMHVFEHHNFYKLVHVLYIISIWLDTLSTFKQERVTIPLEAFCLFKKK